MKLEKIGFYTLSDERCQKASAESPLMRCELILTDKCNFKCPYCRGLHEDIAGTMTLDKAKETVRLWASGTSDSQVESLWSTPASWS